MKAVLEVTEWRDTSGQPNHVYWMNDSGNKIYAYARWGNPRDTHEFKTPITIDQRGRKFVTVRHDIYNWQHPDEAVLGREFKVSGSGGNVYTVTEDNQQWHCSCAGFMFRGQCRHIAEIQLSQ